MRRTKVQISKTSRYGRMRLEFIRRERQELYIQLLFSAGINELPSEIDKRAKKRIWELT